MKINLYFIEFEFTKAYIGFVLSFFRIMVALVLFGIAYELRREILDDRQKQEEIEIMDFPSHVGDF